MENGILFAKHCDIKGLEKPHENAISRKAFDDAITEYEANRFGAVVRKGDLPAGVLLAVELMNTTLLEINRGSEVTHKIKQVGLKYDCYETPLFGGEYMLVAEQLTLIEAIKFMNGLT